MMHLITGASASGKSAYAEEQLVKAEGPDKYYLATWTTQDFSYSLSVDEGIDLETILNIIQNSME